MFPREAARLVSASDISSDNISGDNIPGDNIPGDNIPGDDNNIPVADRCALLILLGVDGRHPGLCAAIDAYMGQYCS